jgi:glycosyltransferase involved in cell wall biosynthesis
LRNDERIRLVFVGGGKKKQFVDDFVRSRGLANCVFAGYQPREKLDASLSCADVHLASLLEGVEGIMVPCKLFGGMAAARPTIFIGHTSSELARILTEHEAGLTVRQGDVDGLVKAIRGMANNPQMCKEMGDNARNALINDFSRDKTCEQWRELLETLETPKLRNFESPKEVAQSRM